MKIPSILLLSSLSLFAEPSAEVMAAGQATAAMCMACHGADGQGLSLGAAGKMAPSLTGSAIATGNPEAFVLALLQGIKKEDAKYVGVMAPLGASFLTPEGEFDAQKMASLMTYVRNSYDNSAGEVTTEEAQAAYEKVKDHEGQPTRVELTEMASKEAE